MEKVNRILRHPSYKKALESIEKEEENRIFCRHDMEHFLSAARLAYIYNLEEGAGISREIIYAAALLHDIGRAMEYEMKVPHQEAGAQLAGKILAECGFEEEEQELIIEAIRSHRTEGKENWSRKGSYTDEGPRTQDTEKSGCLSKYLYRADKKSRLCFSCRAQKECNWEADKRNMAVEY